MTRIPVSARATLFALLLPIVLLGARCPVPGQTHFVSAERVDSYAQLDYAVPLAATATDPAVRSDGQVVEGDLFRMIAPGRLLNLNAYRGLQVIDLTDVTHPRITGRLPLFGHPVEMYVLGDVALVLLSGVDDPAYRGLLDGVTSSQIVAVDLRDPSRPVLLDQIALPGSILTSRLTQSGGHAALYVVASDWGGGLAMPGGISTIVTSYDVAGGLLEPVGRLDLGGSVTAVQATAELLMVARQESWSSAGSRVALVDIRDPSGVMELGDEVAVAGQVTNQFGMDAYRGILRIVSGRHWGADGVNTLQTFEASDPSDVVAIDAATFGTNENLFATLFLGNRAFFVTYLRIDPFHAFEISDEGLITPHVEFEVSGWNDFFNAVFDDSRLIGIGVDDQGGRTLAVSLYDVTDLDDPEPLLARERVAADGASSEASWDHRAFSVIEDAVSVPGPNGAVETGLVLLPYTAWVADAQQQVADVQIFTFSADTLTRRGSMSHGTPVRRSFAAGEDQVANLSEEKLGLFATANPDAPVQLGSVELAPSYSDVLRFGDYRVRVVDGGSAFLWYGGWQASPAAFEVIPAGADPDLAEPVARVELAPGAVVHRTGSLLVSIASDSTRWTVGETQESEITVYDLGDPTHPRRTGQLRTDRLQPAYAYGDLLLRPIAIACIGCFAPGPIASNASAAIPGGLAFLQGDWDRAWMLDVLDLSDPAQPRFADRIGLGAGVEGIALLVSGSDVWIAAKDAIRTDRRGRTSARYFALRVDVSEPSAPAPDPPINVPGELVAIDGDRIFTRDHQWSRNVLETAVVRLVLEPPLARVEAVRWFEERAVDDVRLDGAGHVLVMSGPAWSGFILYRWPPVPVGSQALTVLDADSDDLAVLSESKLESSAWLVDAIPGRALLRTSGGLLVFDLDDASAPHPQAFHPLRSWTEQIRIDGRNALVAGGRYGIERFDLDAVNLPPE